jgi:hypothetical protein
MERLEPVQRIDPFDDYTTGAPGLKPLDMEQFEEPDPVQNQINSMNAALEPQLEPQKTFEQRFTDYKDRLNPLISGQNQRPRRNFYDMASTLGAAILSSDPTEGLYRGLGRGFAAFNEQLKKDEIDLRAEQRQIGLQAFEMAMADERAASDYLRQKDLELLKQKNKGRKYVRWAIPELGADGKPTGKVVYRTAAETDLATQEQYKALGGYPAKTSGDVIVGSNVGKSKFLPDVGTAFAKAVAGWGEEAALARSTQNTLDEAKKVQAGLKYDDVGRLASITLPAREILSDLGFIAKGKIDEQQLLQALGTRISMGLIGKTKGAISNSEMELFLSASPGLILQKDGFNKLVNYLTKINKLSIDFKSAYDDAVINGEFNEAFETGNDAVIAATIGAWQTKWHKDNSLFESPSERSEIEAISETESDVAKSFRRNYSTPSDDTNTSDVSAEY